MNRFYIFNKTIILTYVPGNKRVHLRIGLGVRHTIGIFPDRNLWEPTPKCSVTRLKQTQYIDGDEEKVRENSSLKYCFSEKRPKPSNTM
jgi:hypothetical protein